MSVPAYCSRGFEYVSKREQKIRQHRRTEVFRFAEELGYTISSSPQPVDLNGPLVGINNPILCNGMLDVSLELQAAVATGNRRGENLSHRIGRTLDPGSQDLTISA